MAGHEDLWEALAGAEDLPRDPEPGELSRLSIQGLIASMGLPPVKAAGTLRLHGDGVANHAARFDSIGALCTQFQRLVGAVGAAEAGFKASRGRINESVMAKLRIGLVASPSPGSLTLDFEPVIDPEDEVRPGGQAGIVEADPLIDTAMSGVLQLLAHAAAADPMAEQLTEHLGSLGPRSASALAGVATVLATDRLAVDLVWARPGTVAERVSVTTEQARWVQAVVSAGRLDEAEVEFSGTFVTLSSRRALEILRDDDHEVVSIKTDDLHPVALPEFRVGQVVRVRAFERVAALVGGGETRSYTMIKVVARD